VKLRFSRTLPGMFAPMYQLKKENGDVSKAIPCLCSQENIAYLSVLGKRVALPRSFTWFLYSTSASGLASILLAFFFSK
jgi:hypothetical protein